jgi:hypothetical protein
MRLVVSWVVVIVATVVLGWGGLHVFLSPVNPAQEAPSGHWDLKCGTCHSVSDSVKVREV